MICLDTTVLVDLLKPKQNRHRRDAEIKIGALTHSGRFLFTTRINVAEILVGAHRGPNPPAERERIQLILNPLTVLELDERAAERFAEIKASTLRTGCPIGDADLLIAAIAQVSHCSVLTRNTRHFQQVAGLNVETY